MVTTQAEEPTEPLPAQVLRRIRAGIIDGRYPLGSRLRERDLSVELGVSRVPVREALQQLAREGFVSSAPRRGAVVRMLTPRDVEELFDIRAHLETLAAREAARRCGEGADSSVLDAAMQRAKTATASGDPQLILDANIGFHEAMVELAGHALLADLMPTVLFRTRWLFGVTASRDAGRQCQEHGEIHAAVVAGEVELAGLLSAAHVESGRRPSQRILASRAAGEHL